MPATFRDRQGMTLVEVLIATAVCSVLFLLVGMMIVTLFNLTDNQSRLVNVNQQGMKLVDDIGRLLNDAILPIHVEAAGAAAPENPNQESAWEDVDSDKVGFGGEAGDHWLRALEAGVDSLAFAQVVQVLGSVHDNRYDKDETIDTERANTERASRVLIGQVRSGKGFLGASIVPRSNSAGRYRFDFRADPNIVDEPVNVLAMVDPDRLNSQQFEAVAVPDNNDWRGLALPGLNAWPNRTAFMAIRYIPRVNPATGAPWEITEENAFRGGRVDLDGDGKFDGRFNVGRLQLVYSGGSDLFTENAAGTALVPETLAQVLVDLCPDIILRNVERRTPIFQLADPNPANLANPVNPVNDAIGAYLRVSLLLVDNSGVGSDGLQASPHAAALLPRWYESGIFMNNMRR